MFSRSVNTVWFIDGLRNPPRDRVIAAQEAGLNLVQRRTFMSGRFGYSWTISNTLRANRFLVVWFIRDEGSHELPLGATLAQSIL